MLIGCGGKTLKTDDEGKQTLAPCGLTPNCVSSYSKPGARSIEPFLIESSAVESMQKIKNIIDAMAGATVVQEDPLYLHAEFKSKLFGFVDDVEFLADDKVGKIHVRSASRVGFSDLGVNRRRVEDIRSQYERK
ncbi:MAG: DUF1499 domain-containing protein [Desulfamplus sp.]|nr:DUF1499 domain-containing protein [Desulfamplus sp.]